MMNEAGVDIVVVNKNGRATIKDCIDSINRTTPAPYNLIIVDQNSTDGSKEFLSRSRLASHLIVNNTDISKQEALNQGIRVGRYRWVVLIDNDVIIKDNCWIDKLWNYTIDKKSALIDCLFKYEGSRIHNSGFSLCLVNRDCLTEIGLFDKRLPETLYEEDFIVRMEWAGWLSNLCVDLEISVNKIYPIPRMWEGLSLCKYDKRLVQETVASFLERREVKCQS